MITTHVPYVYLQGLNFLLFFWDLHASNACVDFLHSEVNQKSQYLLYSLKILNVQSKKLKNFGNLHAQLSSRSTEKIRYFQRITCTNPRKCQNNI